MINDMSLTSMYHNTLIDLATAPFDDLTAKDEYGDTVCYSLDQFRRLYNDAVESMRAYRRAAEELDHDIEAYRRLVSTLEQRLEDVSTDDPVNHTPVASCDYCFSDTMDSVPISDFLALTDAMVTEIMRLEEEVVRWRKAIMKFLSKDWADGLDQDIFSGLSRTFYDLNAYKLFMNLMHDGRDPLESEEHFNTMWRLKKGTDITSINYLE